MNIRARWIKITHKYV